MGVFLLQGDVYDCLYNDPEGPEPGTEQVSVWADQAAGDMFWNGGNYRRAAFLFEQRCAEDHYGCALNDFGHAAILPVCHVPAQRAVPGGVSCLRRQRPGLPEVLR